MKASTCISIIVPVFNVFPYLEDCLKSLISQTFYDIEIICVDDASTDGSKDIIEKYAGIDNRIIPIYHLKNLSTSQARKDGVAVSTGQYIMFVDGDDALSLDACEVAYQAIRELGTDMVHYDVKVNNCSDVSEARIKQNRHSMSPYLGVLQEDLVLACWEYNKFGFNLWNKIYKGDICRKAFKEMDDGIFPKAQDLYAFFLIAYYSRSYAGIEDCLYHYNFGRGVTGSDHMELSQFHVLLSEVKITAAIESFLIRNNSWQTYEHIIKRIHTHFLNECTSKWLRCLKEEYADIGFQSLVNAWGFEDVLCTLAKNEWFNRYKIASKMASVGFFKHTKNPNKRPKTIAAYYRNIHNGGAQRVVAELCNIWAKIENSVGEPRYKVILITDDDANEKDYYLLPCVIREFIPNYENASKDKYGLRFRAWSRILDLYSVDIIVSSMWTAPSTLWDALSIKGHSSKPAFAIHAHNFCGVPFRYMGSTALDLSMMYQIVDGVVTLSECDRRYAQAFSNNVHHIQNPITLYENTSHPPKTDTGCNLVWVGRISAEKNPLDAIRMMKLVVDKIPYAKLYLVGSGDNDSLCQDICSLIERLKLNANIVMAGFTEHVEDYYELASLYICTSEYEGEPLVFYEAMAYSIPIITYNMPWLSVIQGKNGIITVPQNRYDLLADEVIKKINDKAAMELLGKEGHAYLSSIKRSNIANKWNSFFSSIDEEHLITNDLNKNEKILYQYLTRYQQIGRDAIRDNLESKLTIAYNEKSEINRKLQVTYKEKYDRGMQIKELRNANEKLIREYHLLNKEHQALTRKHQSLIYKYQLIKDSTTFKIGKFILFIPIKIKNIIIRIKKFLIP